MYKIKYFGYDIYKLMETFDTGSILSTRNINVSKYPKFKSIGGALKYVCSKLKTAYHKFDWLYEDDCCDYGNAWVLHIIVDTKNKYATYDMCNKFKDGKIVLRDLLVNVVIEKC